MPYRGKYKEWDEEARDKHRACWRRYYYRNRDRLKARSLDRYRSYVSSLKGYLRIRETNSRANAKRRFANKDRLDVLERFGLGCAFCGKTDVKLCVHHLDGNGRGSETPNNDQKNLVSCCASCHALIHFHKKQLQMKI